MTLLCAHQRERLFKPCDSYVFLSSRKEALYAVETCCANSNGNLATDLIVI